MTPDRTLPLTVAKGRYDSARAEVSEISKQLAQARDRRHRERQALQELMQEAQKDGMTWSQIGAAMGLSAQGASQMFKRFGRSGAE